MKVFALGGYGKVGLTATRLLAQSDLVSEIAIAGRSLERAEKAATEIGAKAVAVHADGTDEQKLTGHLAGYDIIMNAAPEKTVLPTIQAAMRTRTHYCDVAMVHEQVLQLASQAASAGIISIVANGICPGISSLMGMHTARQLEKIEQLQIGRAVIFNWQSTRELTPRQWLKDPRESLAALHEFKPFIAWMLHRLQNKSIQTVYVYRDGRWVETDPVRNGVKVPLPPGGAITSYPYISADPLWDSLSPGHSRVPPVEMWFSPFTPQLHDVLREQALRVIEGEIDSDTATNLLYDTVESDPHRWLTLPDDFVTIPKIWVRAVGYKEGRAARCSCWFAAPMWNVRGWFFTSAALVAAVHSILRGEVRERGVMTAETAFEPLSFFDKVVSLIPDPPPDGKLIGESFEWLE